MLHLHENGQSSQLHINQEHLQVSHMPSAHCPIAQVLHIHHTLTHSYAQTYNTLEFQALEIHTQHTNHNIVRTNLDSFWLKCLEDVQTVGLSWEDQRYRWCWWSLFELTSMTMNVTWLTLEGSPMLGSTSLLSGLGLAPPLVLVLKLLVRSWLLSLLLMLFALLVVVGVDANRVSNSSTIFTWRKSFKSLPWKCENKFHWGFIAYHWKKQSRWIWWFDPIALHYCW